MCVYIYTYIYRYIFFGCVGSSWLQAGYSSLQCAGFFSLWWLLLSQSMGSRRAGFSSCGTRASVVVAHGLSCSATCGIFRNQGSNLCSLHWQADSYPLRHQRSPSVYIFTNRKPYILRENETIALRGSKFECRDGA